MLSANEQNRQRHWVCALQMAERRRSLGLTQQDVVERLARMGVSSTNRALSAMEHGQGIDVGRLPELAIALDCTVTFLLGLTCDPTRWVPDDGVVPNNASTNGHRSAAGDQGRWMHHAAGVPVVRAAEPHGCWFHGVWHPPGEHPHEEFPHQLPQVTANRRPSLRRFAVDDEPDRHARAGVHRA
jgi:transcriptional regulator with XRE-family HTH domain